MVFGIIPEYRWLPFGKGVRLHRNPHDPLTLAHLCHSRVKSSEDTVAKSLEGDYRPEHLFALKESLSVFRTYQELVAETDAEPNVS
jgi:hypothetical protein